MRCPHCKARFQEDGFKCTQCHQMIKVEQKTTWKQIVIGGIVLILLGIAGFAFIYMDSNKVGFFAQDKPQSFNDYSWEELSKISGQMTLAGNPDGAIREAKKHGFVNDDGSLQTDLVKDIELSDGTVVQAQLVGLYQDPRSNNAGNAGMSFVVTVPVSEAVMNDVATNQGGWETSKLRSTLNDQVLASLPADLQSRVLEVNKFTNNTGATESVDAVTATKDRLWALSFVELMGESDGKQGYAEVLNAEGSQYSLFSDPGFKRDILKKIAGKESLNWWLRTPNPETNTQFYSQGTGYDTEQSNPVSLDANDTLYVVIGFCI